MDSEDFWARAERVNVQWPDALTADISAIGVAPVLTMLRADDGQSVQICVGSRDGSSFCGECPAAFTVQDIMHFVAEKARRMAAAARRGASTTDT